MADPAKLQVGGSQEIFGQRSGVTVVGTGCCGQGADEGADEHGGDKSPVHAGLEGRPAHVEQACDLLEGEPPRQSEDQSDGADDQASTHKGVGVGDLCLAWDVSLHLLGHLALLLLSA
ncbi:TPA: hypothetical protein DDY56_00330 [Candidatus Uhrbacteria bacterium]|nr:MAG: hypothetical protein A2258_00955 [Candidatus Uhrbacteria bacterium RIFOXYA2_FULL_41_8]HAL50175.1 hypothetical protein [Candidatus Uhrbacteria bacterium]HAN06312.1 hypothetical protein [Candidatus Uhrbacteria bacterium]HBA51942.1 hypothetical protein [Candidatus Uhrbacteria bacterium]HBC39619.1 hypothetical protein [Candidatus Uhrbacteria bacterium]